MDIHDDPGPTRMAGPGSLLARPSVPELDSSEVFDDPGPTHAAMNLSELGRGKPTTPSRPPPLQLPLLTAQEVDPSCVYDDPGITRAASASDYDPDITAPAQYIDLGKRRTTPAGPRNPLTIPLPATARPARPARVAPVIPPSRAASPPAPQPAASPRLPKVTAPKLAQGGVREVTDRTRAVGPKEVLEEIEAAKRKKKR